MEKSLQRSRPFHADFPACQARSSQGTYWITSPSRRTRKCAETRTPASPAKYGCAPG